MTRPRPLELLRYGVVPYGRALAMQLELREGLQTQDDDRVGYLVCLQHDPVVTLGKRGREADLVSPDVLRDRGVDLFRIDRGGEATYHGPGQLVVYPIVRLDRLGMGVVDLIRGMATSLADTLREYGVEADYDPEHPGVWTTEQPSRKIASVGMRVSRGVTTHGAAINLVNDMIPFSHIVACGMPNAPMTRLQDYLDGVLDFDVFVERFLAQFSAFLEVDFVPGERPLPPPEAAIRTVEF